MAIFGFGRKREKALEGALEEEISGRIRERGLNTDTQEALALLAKEHEEEAQQATQEAERQRERSTKDELTGVFNRPGFEEEMKRIALSIPLEGVQSTRREGFRNMALLMLDIDFFKNYNTELGHAGGDIVLKQVARHLAGKLRIRPTDFVGRYGGEEFVIAFPGASEQDVMSKLSELRQEVGEAGKTGIKFIEYVQGLELGIHMSCGITSYRPGEDIEETIERADRALYFSKNHGRDQANIYNPETMAKLDPRGKNKNGG